MRHAQPYQKFRSHERSPHDSLAVKRDCHTFRMGERTGSPGPESVTAIKVPLQQIFTAQVVESLL